MGRYYNPKITTANLVYMFDFANQPSVNTSSKSIFAYYSNVAMTAPNPSYVTIANGFVTYDRAASANSVQKPTSGGYHTSGDISAYPFIRYNEFYYNDHTFELWFRINDAQPSNWDATETNSFLAGHKGYNIGYTISSGGGVVYYYIWDTSASGFTVFNFSIPSEIVVGNWYQIVVTRSGTTYKKYINGNYVDTMTHAAPGLNGSVANSAALVIGAQGGTADYEYYSKSSIAVVRMYNRALTDGEIERNYAATRGRFGI